MNEELPINPPWLSEEGIKTLSAGYLLPGETTRAMYKRVASTASRVNQDPTLLEDIFHCLWNGFIGLSSPVAANFGTSRALPISCYSVHLSDTTPSIYSHLKEVAMLSKNGGGVGVFLGEVRPSGSPISGGGTSIGIVPWAQQYDLCSRVVSQGGVRRGSFAMYLPIEHPDLPELLLAKDHSKGDPRKFIDSNIAVTITDDFIEKMLAEGGWRQELFGKILASRLISGSPYLIFIDNVNNQNPQCYVDRGLSVSTSNLCSEITLFTDEHHSFVCVLASMVASRWRLWKDWVSPISGRTAPEIAIHLLEAVVSEFIRKAEGMTGLGRAVRSAKKGRPLALGTMGLHFLYQQEMLPFESEGARSLNVDIHRFIEEKAKKASRELAVTFGEPEWCEGSGFRHTHLTAIAPTKTNSVITGAGSEGIEPLDTNAFLAQQAKGLFVRKNPLLANLLKEKGISDEIWDEIVKAGGSVQKLDCLTPHEKEVFKTAREINQFELVRQAAERQPHVCQAQSLNLFVSPYADPAYLFRLHLVAWRNGVKSLYYLKTKSPLKVKEEEENLLVTKPGCPWCVKLKELLTEDEIKFTEITKDEAVQKNIWARGMKTVPQLWVNRTHIGGYTDYVSFRNKHVVEPDLEESSCLGCEG